MNALKKYGIFVGILILILVGFALYCAVNTHPSPSQSSQKSTILSSGMKITSTAFSENTPIPSLYTCDAQDINPPLVISDVPKEAKSLTLIMDDPDAPMGTFVHWVVYNIPPTVKKIDEGKSIRGSISGKNGAGQKGFIGPCPPNGQHRYFFKVYALDTMLSLPAGASKEEVEQAMQGHILSQAQLMGLYKRQ